MVKRRSGGCGISAYHMCDVFEFCCSRAHFDWRAVKAYGSNLQTVVYSTDLTYEAEVPCVKAAKWKSCCCARIEPGFGGPSSISDRTEKTMVSTSEMYKQTFS